MSIRMRHTRAHTGNRRSHHGLEEPRFSKCDKCGEKRVRHTACKNCGTYRGKEVVDVMAKLDKKARKQKEAELAAQEAEKGNKPEIATR